MRIVHPSAVVTEVQGLAAAPDGTVWSIASLSQEVAHIGQGGVLARVRAELTLLETIAVGADGPHGSVMTAASRGLIRTACDAKSFGDPFGSTTDCGPFESQNLTPSGMAFSRDGALLGQRLRQRFATGIGPPGRAAITAEHLAPFSTPVRASPRPDQRRRRHDLGCGQALAHCTAAKATAARALGSRARRRAGARADTAAVVRVRSRNRRIDRPRHRPNARPPASHRNRHCNDARA